MSVLRLFTLVFVGLAFAASSLAQEERVTKDQLPQPVSNTVEKLAPGYQFASAKKEMEHDRSVRYEVNLNDKGGTRFVVSSEGKLLETWESPKFDDLPAPVKKTIGTECNGEPDALVKVTPAGGQGHYRFRVTRSISSDGTVIGPDNLGQMAVVKNEEMPQPVLDAIKRLDPGATFWGAKISGAHAKYGESYEIRLSNNRFLILSPDGKLDEDWELGVKVANLPAPVRAIFKNVPAGGGNPQPDDLIKITPTGKEPFYMYRLNRRVVDDGSIIARRDD